MSMKYVKPFQIVANGTALTIYLTEAFKMAGWERGTPVRVSVTEDNKIIIEKREA